MIEEYFQELCKKAFFPLLEPIFAPLNGMLSAIPMSVARYCAVSLFIISWIVVGVFLKEDYVNRGRPYKSLWTDLRVWTVVTTLPHVIFYFYFN